MKTLVDASVIVAALAEADSGHEVADAWLAGEMEAGTRLFISDHTLAEVYANLTKTFRAGEAPLPCTVARDAIVGFMDVIEAVIETTTNDYLRAVASCAKNGWRSGAVYDAIHVRAAKRERIRRIATFNERHFRPQWEDRVLVALKVPQEAR